MLSLDAIDLKIIEELQKDSKQSIKQISQKINLSITPTHERIKKIEASGIIEKYVAIVKPEMLGKKLIVYCQVTLAQHEDNAFKKFEDYVNSVPKIAEVSYIAGSFDILLKIILKDMNEYQDFVLKEMSQLDIISNIQSSFVIKQIKNNTLISVT